MNGIKLISSKKEFFLFCLIFFCIFLFNILYQYSKYLDLKDEEIYVNKFQIYNIYDKKDFYVLKLSNNTFTFYTSIFKNKDLEKLDFINIAFLTSRITFIDFLKGFYAKSIYYDVLNTSPNFKQNLYIQINNSHKIPYIQELFNALFLAIPISKDLRTIVSNYGISHLIAISGFHLAVIAFILYWIIYIPYSFVHKKFMPYRNIKFDIIVLSMILMFFYLMLVSFVPSLLRAFLMLLLATFFLRNNIKVLSFQTLALTLILLLAFFPKLVFSISLWFSISAVFYIFLYIKYFKNLSKISSFLFFNVWIFLVFNPIVHFLFPSTSYEQLLSPIITLGFVLFYPLELLLHIIGYSSFLDTYIIKFLNYDINSFSVYTPFWFFLSYIFVSLYSVFNKHAFYLLNILLIVFNFYLF